MAFLRDGDMMLLTIAGDFYREVGSVVGQAECGQSVG